VKQTDASGGNVPAETRESPFFATLVYSSRDRPEERFAPVCAVSSRCDPAFVKQTHNRGSNDARFHLGYRLGTCHEGYPSPVYAPENWPAFQRRAHMSRAQAYHISKGQSWMQRD
jgi:hypothetical protein